MITTRQPPSKQVFLPLAGAADTPATAVPSVPSALEVALATASSPGSVPHLSKASASLLSSECAAKRGKVDCKGLGPTVCSSYVCTLGWLQTHKSKLLSFIAPSTSHQALKAATEISHQPNILNYYEQSGNIQIEFVPCRTHDENVVSTVKKTL